MRESLRRTFAVEPRWVDDQAYDTFENARNAMRLLKADGVTRIILVTSGTHMRRASREFTAAGAVVVPAPVGLPGPRVISLVSWVPRPDALVYSYTAAYELVGETVRGFLAATHLRRQ
jgi:uncharacterized SAM-binding protein YcdF (DUF218 family)